MFTLEQLASYSTSANETYKTLIKKIEDPRISQIIYCLFVQDENLHFALNSFIKIGTCTFDRFEARYKEHMRTFDKVSLISLRVIPNASTEKTFHKMMKEKYEHLLVNLQTFNGNFKEFYLPRLEVLNTLKTHLEIF